MDEAARRRKSLAILEVTLAVIAWGVSFVATKVALRDVSPATVIWLRFGIGVPILGLVMLLRRQVKRLPWQELVYFAGIGFLGITFHQWLQATGMLTAQATTTAWIVATTPIFMALLGWVALREPLRRLQILGIGVAALGVLLVVSQGDLQKVAAGRFWTPGDILVLISAPNWAVFSVLSRRGLARYPATLMMFYVMLFGWLFSSGMLALGPGWSEITKLSTPGWMGVLFLGVACSGLAYIFWYDALQALPVAQTGAFVYLEPFVTVLVAAAVLQEPISLAALLGGAAILGGVILVNQKN